MFKAKDVVVSTRMKREEVEVLKQLADDRDIKLSSLVYSILKEYLNNK